jgi:hypothetical protein
VIQAVALAELEGIQDPNAYGDLPLLDQDPAKPAVTAGSNAADANQYDYWDHVEFIIDEANRRGLLVGGRVEDWRRSSVGPAYPLLPVSFGSASLAEP